MDYLLTACGKTVKPRIVIEIIGRGESSPSFATGHKVQDTTELRSKWAGCQVNGSLHYLIE